jgi:hypothetical protein
MLTIIDGRHHTLVLFWQFFKTNQLIAFAKTAINVLFVLVTIDFSTNPTVLKAIGGRRRVKT